MDLCEETSVWQGGARVRVVRCECLLPKPRVSRVGRRRGAKTSITIVGDRNGQKSSPHAILSSLAEDLKLLLVQPRAQDADLACVRHLAEFYLRPPEPIFSNEVRQQLIHLVD